MGLPIKLLFVFVLLFVFCFNYKDIGISHLSCLYICLNGYLIISGVLCAHPGGPLTSAIFLRDPY